MNCMQEQFVRPTERTYEIHVDAESTGCSVYAGTIRFCNGCGLFRFYACRGANIGASGALFIAQKLDELNENFLHNYQRNDFQI